MTVFTSRAHIPSISLLHFWLLLLAGSGGQDVGKGNGGMQHQLQIQDQYHRSLAGFLMPFQIQWRFVISEDPGVPEDRQPSEAEYDGIRQATEDWLTVEIPFFYADAAGFAFREIACRVTDTSYEPTEEWVHNVFQICEVTWESESIIELPTVEQFLTDMRSNYLVGNFIDPYLQSADPQDPRNIFQFAGRVGYITTISGTTGPLPGEDTPAPVTPMPTTMPPATTLPTPTPSPLPQRKDPPPDKCGSIAARNGRGGAAAKAKDCLPRNGEDETRRKRKLKGSKN